MWGSSRSSGGSSARAPPSSASSGGEVIIVPRNFKLLEELDNFEHGVHDGSLSMGLTTPDDILLRDWTASIMGPVGSVHDGRFYEVRVHTGDRYPDVPPSVRFVSRINLPCVDQTTGEVTNRLGIFNNWHRNMSIENVLLDIRREMGTPANRRLPQPPEGQTFN